MALNLQALRVFTAVVEHAALSRAAVADQLAVGTLAALRGRDWDVPRALTLLRLRRRVPGAAARRFEEALGTDAGASR